MFSTPPKAFKDELFSIFIDDEFITVKYVFVNSLLITFFFT